jgi:aspartate/tyrosine/aromatic aminotransferase
MSSDTEGARSLFDQLTAAPPDAIMGLTDAFKKDPHPKKINLTIGVYKDAQGKTPVPSAVKKAEEKLLREEMTKSYLPIEGAPDYGARVQELMFGAAHEIISSGRAVTADTPGGTGALRVAADLLHMLRPGTTVWLSEPTWPNHPGIFEAAGLKVRTYPYYEPRTHTIDFAALMKTLEGAAKGDAVVLHACCHNPTGIDPAAEQWHALAALLHSKELLPFFDFAYQGLGEGLEEDARGLRLFAEFPGEMLVSSSFSKNFGLYNERTGALTLVTRSAEAAQISMTHLRRAIRVNYSTPPAHGAAIITTVLADPALRKEWESELKSMCRRIQEMRELFVRTLKAKGVTRDFSFLTRQRGMFSYSGLTKAQADELREKHGVYIVGSGRINVAGLTADNTGPLCDAIAAVLRN